jgi:regulator of PEP synthase PpsR (kinase-PPPase family)
LPPTLPRSDTDIAEPLDEFSHRSLYLNIGAAYEPVLMRTMFYVSIAPRSPPRPSATAFSPSSKVPPSTAKLPYRTWTAWRRLLPPSASITPPAPWKRPLVFSTLAEPESRELIIRSDALVLDLFHVFLEPLQRTLNAAPVVKRTRSHRISNLSTYESRIAAIDFSLQHDDGARIRDYDKAEIIMIGVSRSGKTPTCLYLAMQFGFRAANYPITEEDIHSGKLPEPLKPFRGRLHGLTIDARRLASIREERRPGSRYASTEQCRIEVRQVESLFRAQEIPFINTTNMSVEEIATRVVQTRGMERHAV